MGRVLLVSASFQLRRLMEQWLRGAGFSTESVATFAEARQRLTDTGPDVLVTDVRLGEFNGLHLAIVGQDRRPALVAVVIGASDVVLEQEAERQGAIYLTEPVTEEGLVAQVTVLLQEAGRLRRWPRKYVAVRVEVECGDSPARIVDLSYGGLRIELDAAAPGVTVAEPGSDLRVSLPAFGVSVDTALVWVGRAPSGFLWCGAALAETNSNATSGWRDVVDRLGDRLQ